MVVRNLAAGMALSMVIATAAAGQDMPNPQAMQMEVQKIMQERPREAEAAARAFLHVIAGQPNQPPADPLLATLDSLKAAAPDVYWSEVAQLTVQFSVMQSLVRRDSVRAALVTQMFALELKARAQQRAYRTAPEAQRAAIRSRLETLIAHHFDLENQVRALEIADIERRLAEVRAESQRRREKRAEFIQFAVDDIIRDAVRPR